MVALAPFPPLRSWILWWLKVLDLWRMLKLFVYQVTHLSIWLCTDMDLIPMLVWCATYLLLRFPTFLLLDLSTKNQAISIFVLLNTFTSMQTPDSIAPSKTNLQSFSTGCYTFLISNHWPSLLILFRFCSSLLLFSFIFVKNKMYHYPPHPSLHFIYRFSPFFLIYSRLNSLPCVVTWSYYKSKWNRLHLKYTWNSALSTWIKVPNLIWQPIHSYPKGVVDFLLQNSPSAKVNIIWYNHH